MQYQYDYRWVVTLFRSIIHPQEHTDYEIIQSSNPDFNKAIVRVNIFSQDHRQTIQVWYDNVVVVVIGMYILWTISDIFNVYYRSSIDNQLKHLSQIIEFRVVALIFSVLLRLSTYWLTLQYIQPQDAHKLGQAELVVIDEAAAIPLPLVKALLGPYLVFMASTING